MKLLLFYTFTFKTFAGMTSSDSLDHDDDLDLVSTTIVSISDGVTVVSTPTLPDEQDRGPGDVPEDELIIDNITTEDTNANNTTTETHETDMLQTSISDEDSTTMRLTTLSPVSDHETPESSVSSCSSNVCRNGGTCLTSIDGFQCHCR